MLNNIITWLTIKSEGSQLSNAFKATNLHHFSLEMVSAFLNTTFTLQKDL